MTRRPTIPPELTHGPFSLEEARAAGLTLSALKGSAWVRLGNELYCRSGMTVDPWQVLAAWSRVSNGLVFSGRTAAWMHGLDYEPTNPVEAMTPAGAASRTRSGILIRRCEPRVDDVVVIRGLRATSLNCTLLEFARRATPVEALVALDMALFSRKTNAVAIGNYANDRQGIAGSARLRRLASLAEPAESPMETRLRWLFIDEGLSRPQVQVDLYDRSGQFIGRADLYYPEARLAIEFDGGTHKNRLVKDNRRQNELIAAGYTVLRFTTADLFERPRSIVAQVRGVLAAASDIARVPSHVRSTSGPDALVTSEGRNAGG